MTWKIRVTDQNNNEINKTLEEFTCDAESSGKELIAIGRGPEIISCFQNAVNSYGEIEDFLNNINYYRKYIPNKQFASKYPTVVEFYK